MYPVRRCMNIFLAALLRIDGRNERVEAERPGRRLRLNLRYQLPDWGEPWWW